VNTKSLSAPFVASLAGLVSVLALSGCSANFGDVSGTPTTTAMHIQGKVHGGQQSLNGAHVYMYAASTAGYGGNGVAAATANASKSLLTNVSGVTTSDGTNYYVTTDQAGNFTIDVAFACTPGTQVYLYSTGGDPQLNGYGTTTGNNTAADLLAVVGDCASATPSAAFPNVTFVTINEVSTVAAAYALAGFTTNPTHIGAPSAVSGRSLSATSIANAFKTALNIVDQATGQAATTTTATGSSGTVPAALINSLADILGNCVNSTGPSATGCSTLFANTASTAGTKPTDTAQAAINIAQNPGQNVAALLGTIPSAPPFTHTLASATDFSLAITYSGLNVPFGVALDGVGNAYVTNSGTTGTNANSVTEISPVGVTTNFSTGGNFAAPLGVAVDDSNVAWVINSQAVGGSYYLSSISGSTVTSFTSTDLNAPHAVSVGIGGGIWIANTGANNVVEYATGSPGSFSVIATAPTPEGIAADTQTTSTTSPTNLEQVTSFKTTGTRITQIAGDTPTAASSAVDADLTTPKGVAVAQGFDVWVVNSVAGAGSVVGVTPGVQTVAEVLTSSDFDDPQFIVFDGSNNGWVSNLSNGAITWWDRAFASTATFTNYTAGGTISSPEGIAVDLSGNVWVANSGNNTVSEIVGLGVPVVTPLQAALNAPYSDPASEP
jgi:hypothetical protein